MPDDAVPEAAVRPHFSTEADRQHLRDTVPETFAKGDIVPAPDLTVEQPDYSLAAHLTGWADHFSNGVTLGVMGIAMIGDARRRRWV